MVDELELHLKEQADENEMIQLGLVRVRPEDDYYPIFTKRWMDRMERIEELQKKIEGEKE